MNLANIYSNYIYRFLSRNSSIFLLVLSFLVSACNQDLPPIEADDFGYPKYTVYAKGLNVTGEQENQLSHWVSTGYKYNGDKLVLMVYNKSGSHPTKYIWNPWLCENENDICITVYDSPKCCFSPEAYDSSAQCVSQYCINPQDKYESINNAPCYLEKGEGLYLLITDPGNTAVTDPNTYESVNRLPSNAGYYTKSLWDETTMWNNGEQARGYSGELIPNPTIDAVTGEETASARSKEEYIDGEAYLKILDRYYEDNSGHLHVTFKRGFDRIVPPPISMVTSFVTEIMDSTAEDIYKRIINDSEYRLSLKILLVMYIVVHGILFIGGVTDITQREFVRMFIRLVIVIQLLTGEDSWKLFDDYFFKFFTNGLNEMIGIITTDLNGVGDTMTFFDSLLSLLFSYETSMKIQALVWSFPSGFVAAFIMYVAFALFAVAIAKAVMLYLLAYMAISLLIIVAPIFICFMLFESTKPLFEGWIRQFVIFFMQTVLVFAALDLMAQMIVDQIYMILGFKACYENWIDVYGFVIAKNWFICPFFDQMDYIEVPGYGYNDASNPEYFCDPYECVDNRYVDLPFLDPDISKEADLISDFRAPTNLNVPMLYESTVLLLMTYLMMKFNDVVPQLAKSIAGGSAANNALANASSSVVADFKNSLSGLKNFAAKAVSGKSQYERELGRRQAFNAVRTAITQGLEGLEKGLTSDKKNIVAKTSNFIVAAPRRLYKTVGFLKDMIMPPGSLMIGSPDRIADRVNKLKNVREGLKHMDAQEGYVHGKSYKEQISGYISKKSGMAEINRRAQEFDSTYKDKETGNFLWGAAAKDVATSAGKFAYSTKLGKALYDNASVARKSIIEEYKANFTKSGREEREKNRQIDSKISALAESYKIENIERDRNDREISEKLSSMTNLLNIDKSELIIMKGDDQRKYIERAYLALSADKRTGDVNAAYNSMMNEIALNGALQRSMRDTDPSIIRREAYATVGIDGVKFEALNTQERIEALNRIFRNSDLSGQMGVEGYQSYRYLLEQLNRERSFEEFAEKETAKRNSLIYKIGRFIENPAETLNVAARIERYMEENGIKIDLTRRKFSYTVALREGDKSQYRNAQIFEHNMRYAKEQLSPNVDANNASAILSKSCANMGINEATLQSIDPARRMQYIENAMLNNAYMDKEKDFEAYKSFRDLKEIVAKDLIADPIMVERERVATEQERMALQEQERLSKITSYQNKYEREQQLDAYRANYSEVTKNENFDAVQVAIGLGALKSEVLLIGLMAPIDQLQMILDKSQQVIGLSALFTSASNEQKLQMLNEQIVYGGADLKKSETYLAYTMLKKSIDIDEVRASEGEAMVKMAKDLGIKQEMLDLVDNKKVREEMIREHAASILGLSSYAINDQGNMTNQDRLLMLDNALKNNEIDLGDAKTYLAYKYLKDQIQSSNPFEKDEVPALEINKRKDGVINNQLDFRIKERNDRLFGADEQPLQSKGGDIFDNAKSQSFTDDSAMFSINGRGIFDEKTTPQKDIMHSVEKVKIDLDKSPLYSSDSVPQEALEISLSYSQKYQMQQQDRANTQNIFEGNIRNYSEKYGADADKLISSLDQAKIISLYEQNKDEFAGAKFAKTAAEALIGEDYQRGLNFAHKVFDEIYGANQGFTQLERDIVSQSVGQMIKDTLEGRINPSMTRSGTANDDYVIDNAARTIGLTDQEKEAIKYSSKEEQERLIAQAVRRTEYNDDNADKLLAAQESLNKLLKSYDSLSVGGQNIFVEKEDPALKVKVDQMVDEWKEQAKSDVNDNILDIAARNIFDEKLEPQKEVMNSVKREKDLLIEDPLSAPGKKKSLFDEDGPALKSKGKGIFDDEAGRNIFDKESEPQKDIMTSVEKDLLIEDPHSTPSKKKSLFDEDEPVLKSKGKNIFDDEDDAGKK